MNRVLLGLAALSLAGCSGTEQCDLLTLDVSLTGLAENDYECSNSAPCTGEIVVEMSFDGDPEPTMQVVYPIEVGDGRTLSLSQSVHAAMLGEKDSFPTRTISMTLTVGTAAGGTTTLSFPGQDFEAPDVVENTEYDGCRVKDEEQISIDFDGGDATES